MTDRMIGPTFANELFAAGLGGLPFSWTSAGVFEGLEGMPEEQAAAVQAVFMAHDPTKEIEVVFTKIFKRDIWSRATEDEAETIDAMLKSQSIKLQRMWNDSQFISTTDDLFPVVQAGAIQAFGEARAGELLEATE